MKESKCDDSKFVKVGKLIKNLNPVNGCTIGCSYCYAKRINDRFKIIKDFSKPEFIEKRLERLSVKRPNTYLMTSMSDFSDWKKEWRDKVFDKIAEYERHVCLFLTKRPSKIKFETNLENVWIGVTVTCKNDKKRIEEMTSNIKAKHYFITFEPIFEEIGDINLEKIDWVVIGTETGNRKGKITAEKEWVMSIVREARNKGVKIFMKESLCPIVKEDNMIQELPESFN